MSAKKNERENKQIDKLRTIIQDHLYWKERFLKDSAQMEDWATCLETVNEIHALQEVWADLDNITL